MNVVKYKKTSVSPSSLSDKYGYLVAGQFAFPFSKLSDASYITLEKDIYGDIAKMEGAFNSMKNTALGVKNLLTLDGDEYKVSKDTFDAYYDAVNETTAPTKKMQSYTAGTDYAVVSASAIDSEATDSANSTQRWRELNDLEDTYKMTIEKVRRFRTMVAEQLNTLQSLLKDYYGEGTDNLNKILLMLNYYIQEMNDGTVTALTMTQTLPVSAIGTINFSSCGCGNTNTNMSLNDSSCVLSYRTAVYNIMVTMFSDVDFWKAEHENANSKTDDVAYIIHEYVAEIIRRNMPLTPSVANWFSYCNCSGNETQQERLMTILERLMKACEYIYDGKIDENRQYIGLAFRDWAVALYQTMRWTS